LSQRSTAFRAPVNRFQAAVDHSLFCHLTEDADLFRLKFRLEGDIGVLEVASHAQADKLLLLALDITHRKLTADLPQTGNRYAVFIDTDLFKCFQLGRKAMGIPPRNIRRL